MRKNRIGASDAPVIMGVSPWTTPYQLWERKVGLKEAPDTTACMQRGIDLEDSALHAFNHLMGCEARPDVLIHRDHPWMMASMDGVDAEECIAVEIKCPGQEDHKRACNGIVPEKYYPQLQHQLAVTGYHMMYYYSYRIDGAICLPVLRSEEYIQNMIKKEKEFFACMTDMEPPELSDGDYKNRDDDLWIHAAIQYRAIKIKMKALEEEEKLLRETLIAMSGGSNTKGAGISLSRYVRRGPVIYKNVPELAGVNLEQYRSLPTETWRVGVYK